MAQIASNLNLRSCLQNSRVKLCRPSLPMLHQFTNNLRRFFNQFISFYPMPNRFEMQLLKVDIKSYSFKFQVRIERNPGDPHNENIIWRAQPKSLCGMPESTALASVNRHSTC